MSQYGNPPEQPDEGSGPPADQGAEKPWSPYPDNWDAPKSPPPPPAPTNPYGQADPYAQQPSPYGDPTPYGATQPAAGQPQNPYAGTHAAAAPAFGFGGYASWLSRVGAYLIDGLLGSVAGFPLWIGYVILLSNSTTTTDANGVQHLHTHGGGASLVLILIGAVTSLVFFIWNVCLRQGRTGATIGKSVLGIRLVNQNLQPIGGGMAFLRYLLHIVDAIPCYLGYLWPIWDSRKQTFADKIMSTVVISAVTPQPRVY